MPTLMPPSSSPAPPEPTGGADRFNPASIRRPDPALMHYYFIIALLSVPAFPFVLIACYIRYRTLEYKLDDKGVSMTVGLLFRREVYLTYRRIQDIHVTRNIIHRWLGLSDVAIQTASGSSTAELTIEGIRNPETLRDFLYAKMRGARDGHEEAATSAEGASPRVTLDDEALSLLMQIRDELRSSRQTRGVGP